MSRRQEDNLLSISARIVTCAASPVSVFPSCHDDQHQNPTSLEKNFCVSSAMGYWNSNSGASGTTAASVIMVSRRGPIVTQRIPFTTLMALARSASDCRSGLPATAGP